MLEPTCVLVVPVKRLATAKSRLRGALPGVPHERLALALALDTVGAAVGCAGVLVVTDDPMAARELAALGARVAKEPGGVPGGEPGGAAGLNRALTHGAALVPGLFGSRVRLVGALTADLPALRPQELAAALDRAAGRRAFVADAAGTGTTLLLAAPGQPLAPRFGPGSAVAHASGGARALTGAWPTLRRDVDAPADLIAAAALGPGPHTAALLREAGPAPPTARTEPERGRYGAGMQGTVATYDADTRSGTLLLDDGTEVAFPRAAFDASGLRLLRLGQRVRVERDAGGGITRVTLPTF